LETFAEVTVFHIELWMKKAGFPQDKDWNGTGIFFDVGLRWRGRGVGDLRLKPRERVS